MTRPVAGQWRKIGLSMEENVLCDRCRPALWWVSRTAHRRAVRETVHETVRSKQKEIAPEDSQERFLVSAVIASVYGGEVLARDAARDVLGVFARVGLSRMLGGLPSRAVFGPVAGPLGPQRWAAGLA